MTHSSAGTGDGIGKDFAGYRRLAAIRSRSSARQLGTTSGYAEAEIERMCREAGFTGMEHRPLGPAPQSLVLAHRG